MLVRITTNWLTRYYSKKEQKEIKLTMTAAVYFAISMVTVATANVISDRININVLLPNEERLPLPDLIMRLSAPMFKAIFPTGTSDMLIAIAIMSTFGLLISLQSPQILRRIMYVIGTTFLLRAFTVLLTVLPNPLVECQADITNSILYDVFRVLTMQKMTCGDVFFSGHTIFFTTAILAFSTYSPSSHSTAKHIVHAVSVFGMFALIAEQYHYTIDVMFGYFVTCTVWVLYHYAVFLPSLRSEMWARFVCQLDGQDDVERAYDVPSPSGVTTIKSPKTAMIDMKIVDN